MHSAPFHGDTVCNETIAIPEAEINHYNFFSIYNVITSSLSNQILKNSAQVAFIFTSGTGNYEKGVVRNCCNMKGVVGNI